MAHIRMNSYGICALSPIYREITLECIQKILHRDHTDSGKNITRKGKQRCFEQMLFFSLAAICLRLCGIPILMNKLKMSSAVHRHLQDSLLPYKNRQTTSAMLPFIIKAQQPSTDCLLLRLANSLSAYG